MSKGPRGRADELPLPGTGGQSKVSAPGQAPIRLVILVEGPVYDLGNYEVFQLETLSAIASGQLWSFGRRAEDRKVSNFSVSIVPLGERWKLLGFPFYLLELIKRAHRLQRIQARTDIVWTYDPSRNGVAGWIVARILGARLVVEVNGGYGNIDNFADEPRVWMRRFKRRAMLMVGSFVLARAHGIKLLFDRQLDAFHVRTDQKIVRRFPALVQNEGLNWLAEDRTVLFVGFPFRRKGVDVLLQAFQRVKRFYPDWQLVLIGFGLAAAIPDDEGLRDRVKMLGPMPFAEAATWIRRCGIFVLPSRSEGMGRVLVEAAFAAKPRIGSRVEGIPTVIEHGVDGLLVEKESAEDLAAALTALMADPVLRRSLGENAFARAQREFSPLAYLQSVASLSAAVLEG
jgi:glycosyltransferase involved in cell wall biosynthesis